MGKGCRALAGRGSINATVDDAQLPGDLRTECVDWGQTLKSE